MRTTIEQNIPCYLKNFIYLSAWHSTSQLIISDNGNHTINPRTSLRGLICKNKFLDRALIEGGLFKGDLLHDSVPDAPKKFRYLNCTRKAPVVSLWTMYTAFLCLKTNLEPYNFHDTFADQETLKIRNFCKSYARKSFEKVKNQAMEICSISFMF